MPSNHTPNYSLNQWEAGDRVQRTDFNADNAKIDAAIKVEADARAAGDAALSAQKADKTALAALTQTVSALPAQIPKITFGTYTGNGAAERIISLPFTPRMVVVCTDTGMMYYTYDDYRYYYGGFAFPDRPMKGNGRVYLSIVENGFKIIYLVENQSSYSHQYVGNKEGNTYIYIAVS